MDETTTSRKAYQVPRVSMIGTVSELTAQVLEKCTGSADATLPRDVPDLSDFACNVDIG